MKLHKKKVEVGNANPDRLDGLAGNPALLSLHGELKVRYCMPSALLMLWDRMVPIIYSAGHLIRIRKAGPAGLDFLFEKGCFLHNFRDNDSQISYFPQKINLSFFVACFLLV